MHQDCEVLGGEADINKTRRNVDQASIKSKRAYNKIGMFTSKLMVGLPSNKNY